MHSAIDSYSNEVHLFPLHPHGRSLTEDCHDERSDKQRHLVQKRIEEIMNSDDPLSGIMAAKLAHRATGHESLFDEAIEALREVFKMDDSQIRNASAEAFKREQERRAKLKEQAKAAARRAGLPVDENLESLAPVFEHKKVDVVQS